MRFRKLRIAWSVGCGIVCVLLIVLWVRSYWKLDHLDIGGRYCIDSLNGQVLLDEDIGGFSLPDWMASSTTSLFGSSITWMTISVEGATPRGTVAAIPDWLLVLGSAAFAAAPWLRWRFSLRTLLIATTLLAVVLGLIVYAAGK